MSECSAKQLRFPPVEGLTVRADFDGGALSSDFGVMLLRGIDQQIGLSEHLAQALDDRRHPSYIDHPLESLFAQRTYQIACGYADGNDANEFEGLSGKFITAALRPGKRPTGAENAMILKRVLKRLRAAWPETVIVLRGDSHFANPQLMQLALEGSRVEFIFGLSANAVLLRRAQPLLVATCVWRIPRRIRSDQSAPDLEHVRYPTRPTLQTRSTERPGRRNENSHGHRNSRVWPFLL